MSNERKVIKEIEEVCGQTLRRLNMQSYDQMDNVYNYDKEDKIIMLSLDLTTLDLDEKKLQRLGESVKKLKHIERFLLKCPKDDLPEWFKDVDYVKELLLKNCYLTSLPDGIKEFKNLTYLNLINNELRNLPDWLPTLPELKVIEFGLRDPNIDLNQENVSIIETLLNKGVTIKSPIINLHVKLGIPLDQLNIIRNFKDGYNLVRFDTMKSIKDPYHYDYWGNIHLCVFEGKIRQMAAYSYGLKELPEDFGKLDGLIYLKLSDNQIESLPESFGELKELKELDLSNNSLKNLPDSFVNLTSIIKLNLCNNQFGEIPTELWALKELTELNLANNPLSTQESNITQKVPDLIRKYLRKKATIRVFISHAVIDFEGYRIRELVDYLGNQKEISQVFFCEADLAGNIDEWMLKTVQNCQLLLFVATNKSVFHSPDCANELQLANKFSIPIIPLKGEDVEWSDLTEKNLSRELGLEFDKGDFNTFCNNLYKYILNFKQEIDLMDREARQQGVMDIYERFRLMLEDKLGAIQKEMKDLVDKNTKTISALEERIASLEKRIAKLLIA